MESGSKYRLEGVTYLEEGINAQIEVSKRISEGMKRQIGNIRKRKEYDSDSEDLGARFKSYLDVIFIQVVLLLMLYGVCKLVVPTLA